MHMKKILFLLLALLATVPVFAYDFKVDGLCYILNNDGNSVTVTYDEHEPMTPTYSNLSDTLIIPASITYNGNTYCVTSIGVSAFSNCWGVVSVIIPNSVTSIGSEAFAHCGSLETVIIPDSVISIGGGVFCYCSSLSSVSIGKSVASIGGGSEAWEFERCYNLISVEWNAINCTGAPFGYYPESIESFTFGNEVERIPAGLCGGMTSLTEVTIPQSVTSIGDGAFSGCTGLYSLTIPDSVVSIGSNAFSGCTGLYSLKIGKSVTSIGNDVFNDCYSLSSVIWNVKRCNDFFYEEEWQWRPGFNSSIHSFIFGDEVERIPAYLCSWLSDLTSVTIPNSVTEIGYNAFKGCYGLNSIVIPKSVTEIGEGAFRYCSGLTSVIVENDNIKYDSRNNSNAIIETATNKLLFGCNNTTIPNSVSSIGNYAFADCSGLTTVTIPNWISIGAYAFEGCSGLTSLSLTGKGAWNHSSPFNDIFSQIKTLNVGSEITSLGNFGLAPDVINSYAAAAPTCSSGTFSSYDGALHVPTTSTVSYFTANYWQNFNNLTNDLTEKVVLNQTEADIPQWGTIALSATTNSESGNVLWCSNNPTIAVVSDEGIVTAICEGECDIFAILESNDAVYASCHVSVSYPEITVSLNYDELEMSFGESTTLVATISPDNTGLKPTWASNNESVATVENGVVTAIGEGECDITVTVLNKTATCHVIVNSNIIISLSKKNVVIGVNQILTVYPTCTPDVPVELVVTSSDPSVAMVRLINRTSAPYHDLISFFEKGMAVNHVERMVAPFNELTPALANEKAIMIVGVSVGTATITVSTTDGLAEPATIELRVVDVNGDGSITAADVTALYDLLLNGNNTYIDYSDVNGDGNITSADITTLYNIMLGN